MTQLLLHVIARLQKLPSHQQDEIATRILEDLKADENWETAIRDTTEVEWTELLREIDAAIEKGEHVSLDDFLRV